MMNEIKSVVETYVNKLQSKDTVSIFILSHMLTDVANIAYTMGRMHGIDDILIKSNSPSEYNN